MIGIDVGPVVLVNPVDDPIGAGAPVEALPIIQHATRPADPPGGVTAL
jgi:hypothetical protein